MAVLPAVMFMWISLFSRTGRIGEPADSIATEIYQKPDVNISSGELGWVGEPADSMATEIYQKHDVNITLLENWLGRGTGRLCGN